MAKIDELFHCLIEKKGSDLHLEQGQKPKLRVQGEISEIEGTEVLTEEILKNIFQELVTPALWDKFNRVGDLDFAYAMGDAARFRSNFYRHFHGMGAVFRIIPTKILTLDQLNTPAVLKNFGSSAPDWFWLPAPPEAANQQLLPRLSIMSTKRPPGRS